MSPPASERAEALATECAGRATRALIAPLGRGADGAARRPYHLGKHVRAAPPRNDKCASRHTVESVESGLSYANFGTRVMMNDKGTRVPTQTWTGPLLGGV